MARLLIVDDDPAVSEMFGRMLQGSGYEVDAVHSAEDGLNRIAAEPPDAVILDIRMPLVSGIEFLRRLRTGAQQSAVPVGVITGDYFLRDETLAEIERLGALVRYKPLAMADLLGLAGLLMTRQGGES
jgi:DNA-binding response OmpR family regulator